MMTDIITTHHTTHQTVTVTRPSSTASTSVVAIREICSRHCWPPSRSPATAVALPGLSGTPPIDWSTSYGRTIRGDSRHLMRMECIAPQSEVIRAILLEDSPCCGSCCPHRELRPEVVGPR